MAGTGPAMTDTSHLVAPPHPCPSPQGGGKSQPLSGMDFTHSPPLPPRSFPFAPGSSPSACASTFFMAPGSASSWSCSRGVQRMSSGAGVPFGDLGEEHRQLQREMGEDVADHAGQALPAGLDGRVEHGAGGLVIGLPGARRRLGHAAEQALAAGGCAAGSLSSARSTTKAAPWRSWPVSFFCFFGKVSCRPAARARQGIIHGQSAQAGRLGVQMVAPRSITAWAKSPGRSPGTSSSVRRADQGLCLGQRLLDHEEPGHDPLHIAVDRRRLLVEGDGRHRRRRIGADARQLQQFRLRRGKAAAMLVHHRLGAGMEVAGAGIVAEPGPGLHDRIGRRLGQRLDGREALQEAQVKGLTAVTVVCCSMISDSQTR